MSFKEQLDSGKFVVTAELQPPKGIDLSELLNASALGLKNILILQGDHPSIGDHFEAQPVFDLDVIGLLGAAKRLQEGYDLMGNDLKGKPQFFVGTQVK